MELKLEKIEEIIVNLKRYTTSTIEIVKLEAVERTSSIVANFISGLIIGLVAILFAFFLSMGICLYLSELLDNTYWGFGIVAGAYLLLGIVLTIGRKKLLNKPIRDKFIHELFQEQLNTEQNEPF
jgi:ABC-type multidrug transport system permease subunit